MPPVLALFLTIFFCSFMLWRDYRSHPSVSPALWLPVVWIFIVGSRFLGQWLALFGLIGGGEVAMEDGSVIDAIFFLLLIAAGVWVLARRNVTVAEFARNNRWMAVFFIYCLVSILWSDFPLVAFKRWIKILGHPVMALVVLTELDRAEALRTVLKRCAYLHVPLSVLFIKYYPEYGRGFDNWTGEAFNRGINLNKNELGYACMVFGLAFLWNVITVRRRELTKKLLWQEYAVCGFFLFWIWWLLDMSNSATSLVCVVLGGSTMAVVGSRMVSKRFLGTYVVTILVAAASIEMAFDAYAAAIKFLGRNPTLTDRTEVWADLFVFPINPVIGAGFESFWLGERLQVIWAKWWWHPNQAHNGYIETYLNLGWVGVAILAALIIATFRKARWELLTDLDFGRFRLGVLFAIVFYNYTEAAFKGVHLVWTLFHLIAIDYPVAGAVRGQRAPAPIPDRALLVENNPRLRLHAARPVAGAAARSGRRNMVWR